MQWLCSCKEALLEIGNIGMSWCCRCSLYFLYMESSLSQGLGGNTFIYVRKRFPSVKIVPEILRTFVR